VDIVGLYMNPSERALVVCVDKKSQMQALDRTQSGLPQKKPVRGDGPRRYAQRDDDAVGGEKKSWQRSANVKKRAK